MKNKFVVILCLCLVACANTKLEAIKGKSEEDILRERGNPIAKVRESDKKMWTYRYEQCTEMIFFDGEQGVVDLYETGECHLPE